MRDEHSVTIYHREGARSLRVVWVCEELNAPYRLVYEPGNPGASLEMIRKVAPLTPMVPVLEHRGQVIIESGAMVELIQARFGKAALVPEIDSEDFAWHLQWFHVAEGSAMYRLWARRFAAMVAKLPIGSVPDSTDIVGVKSIFDLMETHLDKYSYFGGRQFTTADIMMHIFSRAAKLVAGFDPMNYSRVLAWRHAVESRAAFKRALAVCVPGEVNEYLLPKAWPMPDLDLPVGPAPIPARPRATLP